jgi:predicted nucleic acid-binding protein
VLAVTSELALAECLVKPMVEHNQAAAAAFQEFFTDGGTLAVVPISREILIRAAELRANTRMPLPDAIHVATAEITACTIFISGDRRIKVPAGIRLAKWIGFHME